MRKNEKIGEKGVHRKRNLEIAKTRNVVFISYVTSWTISNKQESQAFLKAISYSVLINFPEIYILQISW